MKPILFNTEMVKAILEGGKTITRRVVKPQPPATAHVSKVRSDYGWSFWKDNPEKHYMKPPYRPGDILWVRETWCESLGQAGKYFYRAYAGQLDEMKEYAHSFNRWRPSIHMPLKAARIFLRVTGVRVERLQDISYADVIAEGIPAGHAENTKFMALWDGTMKREDRSRYGWNANPWVWVFDFERIRKEEAMA